MRQLPLNYRLLSTCMLISAERLVAALGTLPPQHGVYPMLADIISADLDATASKPLHEHRTNMQSRLAEAQQQLDRTLYRSSGSFSYTLPVPAIMQEASDRLLCQFIEQRAPAQPADATPRHRIGELLREVSRTVDYAFYQQAMRETPDHEWDLDSVLGLLESAENRGTLSRYAGDGLLRYVRYGMLEEKTRDNDTARRLIGEYCQTYLGTAEAGNGVWQQSIAANRDLAVAVFQNHFFHDVAALLNDDRSGSGLTDAQALAVAATRHMEGLQQSLEQHMHILTEPLREQRSTATEAEQELARSSFNLWRRLLGHTTTLAQERVLNAKQVWLDAELEMLTTQGACEAARQMADIARRVRDHLATFRQSLHDEGLAARQRLEAARQRRRAQIDLGRVRHEWGMPHTDVTHLRNYLAADAATPRSERMRRFVEELHNYLEGKHIDEILATRPETWPDAHSALGERLYWTWDADAAAPVPTPMIYLHDRAYLVGDGTTLRESALALYRWMEELCLPDMLMPQLDTPAHLARQLDDERTGPAIHYVPTPGDRHELYTFLLVPPPNNASIQRWFDQVVDVQQVAGTLHAFHKLISASHPQRVVYLSTYELIGRLKHGALPTTDYLADTYDLHPTMQPRWVVAKNEALAVGYEQQRRIIRRPLHPRLVDSLHHPQRVEVFARALVCSLLRQDYRDGSSVVVAWLDNTAPRELGAPVDSRQSPWVAALRWFTLAADEALVQALARAVARHLPEVDAEAYEHWLNHGLIATLQQSDDTAERDLAALLETVLEPDFEANP
jgi:hypothetical protein